MSARRDDEGRLRELYAVVAETLSQIEELGFTEEQFKHPSDVCEELVADGLIARVLRVTEEAGCLSEDIEPYGIPVRSCRDMRNIIAHTYWRVDKDIIWHALIDEFPHMKAAAERYADDKGISLGAR
jgi:uncharacterized protein with HEPN domain